MPGESSLTASAASVPVSHSLLSSSVKSPCSESPCSESPCSESPCSESSRLGSTRSGARTIYQAQQHVYDYLLSIVKSWIPTDVLTEFKHLFIHHAHARSPEVLSCLYEVVFANHQQEFYYTLKRSCYILINNWDVRRNRELIQQLIALFSDPILDRPTISPTLKRLRQWLREFAAGPDFQELKLYAERYDQHQQHWTHHFASYLLVSQFANLDNSAEQRQAARRLSRQLREQFKFDLARYTAFSESPHSPPQRLRNPTGLGDRSLFLIKRIVLRRGFFSYANLARIFVSQTQGLSFRAFKPSLLGYLTFGIDHAEFVPAIQTELAKKLERLYCDRDEQQINYALLLRTANRLIDYLLTENGKEPSPLFILLLSKGNALLLVMVLLKIVLVCRHVRVHLETRIAQIVCYYEECPESECRWVIDFLEILHITLTIHTENVQYTLVNMNYAQSQTALHTAVPAPPEKRNLETYRIFSQLRSTQARLHIMQSSFPQTTAHAAAQITHATLAPALPAEILSSAVPRPGVTATIAPDITPA